jgi:hypothetical protein
METGRNERSDFRSGRQVSALERFCWRMTLALWCTSESLHPPGGGLRGSHEWQKMPLRPRKQRSGDPKDRHNLNKNRLAAGCDWDRTRGRKIVCWNQNPASLRHRKGLAAQRIHSGPKIPLRPIRGRRFLHSATVRKTCRRARFRYSNDR